LPSLDPPFGAIPDSPEELSVTWLASVLSRFGFSSAIDAVEFGSTEGTSLTSEVLRVVPRFRDETTGVAPALLWKRSAGEPARRETFAQGYATEVAFYREVAAGLGGVTPRCFCAAFDEGSAAHVLLLEDLSPAVPADLGAGLSAEQVRGVLGELARVHAIGWGEMGDGRSSHRELASEPRGPLDGGSDVADGARTRRFREMGPALRAVLAGGPQTLIHGDVQPSNVVLAEGRRPRLVDWQCSRVDAPMRDVARLLVLGMTVEERRAHERDLVSGYLDALAELGVRYEAEVAAEGFRAASMLEWGSVVALHGQERWWDADTRLGVATLVERAAATFDDLVG